MLNVSITIMIWYRLASAGRMPLQLPEKAVKLHLESTPKVAKDHCHEHAMSISVWIKSYRVKMVNPELYNKCLILTAHTTLSHIQTYCYCRKQGHKNTIKKLTNSTLY